MSILAIDFGLKRIGVAGTDDLEISSHPIKLIINKNNKSHIEEIINIINERKPELVLIGVPSKDDGRLKIQDHIENFYNELKVRTDTKIKYWNENFTSKEADEILIRMNISRKKRRSYQDMLSACLIIDSYLRSF